MSQIYRYVGSEGRHDIIDAATLPTTPTDDFSVSITGNSVPITVLIWGDSQTVLTQNGASDILTGANGVQKNEIYGDASNLLNPFLGGNDSIVGGSAVGASATNPSDFGNWLYGDAFLIGNDGLTAVDAKGGNDTLRGGAGLNSYEFLFGDADTIRSFGRIPGSARGGNDLLFGSNGSQYSNLYGDGTTMTDVALGGDDELVGADNTQRSILVGDAYDMGGTLRTGNVVLNVVGGADTIWGGDNTAYNLTSSAFNNYLVGDGFTMGKGARGGQDELIGGDSLVNWMIGDGYTMLSGSTANSDSLYSGPGNDYMFGDFVEDSGAKGAADLFIFNSIEANGVDEIIDFSFSKNNNSSKAIQDALIFSGSFLQAGDENACFAALKNYIFTAGVDSKATFFRFAETASSLYIYDLPASVILDASDYNAFNAQYPGVIRFVNDQVPAPPN